MLTKYPKMGQAVSPIIHYQKLQGSLNGIPKNCYLVNGPRARHKAVIQSRPLEIRFAMLSNALIRIAKC